MFVASLLIVLGFIVLVYGADVLVRSASALAVLFRMTPAVIGLTIVAFGTSAPELAVSMSGALRGSSGIAVGNVVGSNILNIGLVLGLATLVRPVSVRAQAIKLEWPVMFLAAYQAHLAMRDGIIDWQEGVLFLAMFLTFTVYMVFMSRQEVMAADRVFLEEEAKTFEPKVRKFPPVPFYSAGVVLGIALLVLGSQWLVDGASEIARRIGWSEMLIGLTIVAFGTSLPELATSLVAAFRGRDDLAVGNLIGSNIANVFFILGATSTVRAIPIPEETFTFDNYWMIGISALLFPLMFSGKKIQRWEGALLFASFVAYFGMRFLFVEGA